MLSINLARCDAARKNTSAKLTRMRKTRSNHFVHYAGTMILSMTTCLLFLAVTDDIASGILGVAVFGIYLLALHNGYLHHNLASSWSVSSIRTNLKFVTPEQWRELSSQRTRSKLLLFKGSYFLFLGAITVMIFYFRDKAATGR